MHPDDVFAGVSTGAVGGVLVGSAPSAGETASHFLFFLQEPLAPAASASAFAFAAASSALYCARSDVSSKPSPGWMSTRGADFTCCKGANGRESFPEISQARCGAIVHGGGGGGCDGYIVVEGYGGLKEDRACWVAGSAYVIHSDRDALRGEKRRLLMR